jgi:cytochrome P450
MDCWGGEGGSEESVRRMEKYGMWWGFGDRECTGKHYAMMQMQKLMVEVIRRFDVKLGVKSDGERFYHERGAVRRFWRQMLIFEERGGRT